MLIKNYVTFRENSSSDQLYLERLLAGIIEPCLEIGSQDGESFRNQEKRQSDSYNFF
jgi:hypothetical protein